MTGNKMVLEYTQPASGKNKSAEVKHVFIEQATPNEDLRVGRQICNGLEIVIQNEERAPLVAIREKLTDPANLKTLRVVNHIDDSILAAEDVTDEMTADVADSVYDGYTEVVEDPIEVCTLEAGTADTPPTLGWRLAIKLAQPTAY